MSVIWVVLVRVEYKTGEVTCDLVVPPAALTGQHVSLFSGKRLPSPGLASLQATGKLEGSQSVNPRDNPCKAVNSGPKIRESGIQ